MIALRCAIVALLAGVVLAAQSPLEIETKIPLGDIHGRIDHLAIDVTRQRLFVAELGNDSVGVVDLKGRKVLRTIGGLKEPQGIGYVPSTDTLYIANAGDGSVRLFQGGELAATGQIALGDDADNVRVDDAAHRVYVGHGSGGLGVIDTASRRKIADIPLKGHPESFQIDPTGKSIYVNVPDAHQIALIDRTAGKQVAAWSTEPLRANYPLALDAKQGRVVVVFRHPAKVAEFDAQGGRMIASVETCGDSDDVFLDGQRNRLYVTCGEGFIEVFEVRGSSLSSLARLPTVAGARTSFFSSDFDRFFLAVRASGATPASIWVLRP